MQGQGVRHVWQSVCKPFSCRKFCPKVSVPLPDCCIQVFMMAHISSTESTTNLSWSPVAAFTWDALKLSIGRSLVFCCSPNRGETTLLGPRLDLLKGPSKKPSATSSRVASHRRRSESAQPELFVAAMDLPEKTFAILNKCSIWISGGLSRVGNTSDAGNHPLRGKPCRISKATLLSGYSMSSNNLWNSITLFDASTLRTCTSICSRHPCFHHCAAQRTKKQACLQTHIGSFLKQRPLGSL